MDASKGGIESRLSSAVESWLTKLIEHFEQPLKEQPDEAGAQSIPANLVCYQSTALFMHGYYE